MTKELRETTVPRARSIHDEGGSAYVLAPTEQAARAFAEAEGYELREFVGWMMKTGWDQDNYESQEQFEAESGFTSWWSGVQNVGAHEPSESLLRAWEARSV